jgi:hypothetical protein
MPHITRDPETGRFVSSEAGHIERFRDFMFQHVHNSYSVSAGDVPGSFPIEESDISTIEMDDLLHRDERADLVRLNIHALQSSVPGTSSAESALETRFELTLGAGDEMVLTEDQTVDNNTGSSGVVDRIQAVSDNPDVLWFGQWTAEGGFADTSSGPGGGPDQPVITDEIDYPRDFGACPTLDHRDEITESFQLDDEGSADISDSLVNLDVSYSLVFAVYEE